MAVPVLVSLARPVFMNPAPVPRIGVLVPPPGRVALLRTVGVPMIVVVVVGVRE